MTPLTSFGGGDGWLAPGEGGYTSLGTASTERGLAYGNDHLYLVSRAGGNFIRILDPLTGGDLGALNTTGIAGGTFAVNMAAVGGDGAIYVGNLTVDASSMPFTVYKWATEGAMPEIAYTGTPLAGGRVGDTLAVIGSGSATLLAAGFGHTPSVSGNNGYAIVNPTAGTSTQVGFSPMPPFPGDFRLGITFIDSVRVLGSQGGNGGNPYAYTNYLGTTGLLLARPPLANESVLAYAVVNGRPLLATLNTSDPYVSIYDMTDPANPLFLTEGKAPFGIPLAANPNGTGALAWGGFSGNTARLYAMSTNHGIQAWTITAPTIVVTTLDDHDDGSCGGGDCTLREAINAANSLPGSDIIIFAPGLAGIIQLNGSLPRISTNMTLEGPGADFLTVRRNTGGDYRVLWISNGTTSGPTVNVSGLTLANGSVNGPFPSNSGGAILNDHGDLTLNRVTLSGNVCANFGGGGGVYNYGAGGGNAELVVSESTFNNNNGNLSGGGIYNDGADGGSANLIVSNTTFYFNVAGGGGGGGILNTASNGGIADVTVTNCTFADNFGGIRDNSGGPVSVLLRNTVFKSSFGQNLSGNAGVIVSQGHNLSSDAAGGDDGTGPGGLLSGPGDIRNTDPKLDPAGPAHHGGPTTTVALLTASPAINAGNNALAPPLDQRGYLRAGTSDIGAFEFGATTLRFTSFTRLPNGHVSMEGIGVPNAAHTIGRSSTLDASGFIPFPPTTADGSGLIRFTDTTSANLARAFYRLAFP